MLLGKRPRPPIMRRTRSMSGGMAIETQPPTDTNNLEPHHEEELMLSDSVHPHHHEHPFKDPHSVLFQANQTKNMVTTTVMFPSPTTTSITVNNHSQTQKKNPTINLNLPHDVIQHTPHFLRTCRLCTSPLAPGRDIYMYRGDTAFCSLECREKQIKQDQRKEKWKIASNKDEHRVISPPPTANTKSSTKTQTAACN